MSKPLQHKKQHYIPESYLKAWCDPKTPPGHMPYVWQISVADRVSRKRAPVSIFHERDIYTIKGADGGRDLVLEHGLSQLESRFADIRRNKLQRHLSLSQDERLVLCAFTVAMLVRTPYYREWVRKVSQPVVDFVDSAFEAIPNPTPFQRDNLDALRSIQFLSGPDGQVGTYDAFKALVENPTPLILSSEIESKAPLLLNWLKMSIFENNDATGFITSDCPCVWFDRAQAGKPKSQRESMIASPGLEVALPISPRQMLFFSHLSYPSYHDVSHLTMPSGGARVLDVLNRRTCLSGATSIVVRNNVQVDYWFSRSA